MSMERTYSNYLGLIFPVNDITTGQSQNKNMNRGTKHYFSNELILNMTTLYKTILLRKTTIALQTFPIYLNKNISFTRIIMNRTCFFTHKKLQV